LVNSDQPNARISRSPAGRSVSFTERIDPKVSYPEDFIFGGLKNVDLSVEALRINNDEEMADDDLWSGSDVESELDAFGIDGADQWNDDPLPAATRQEIDQMFEASVSRPLSLPSTPTHKLQVHLSDEPTDYILTMRGPVWDSLQPPDAAADHRKFRSRCHPGSGRWFVESATFRQWLNGDEMTLCIEGPSGYGKSVLCSTLIDAACSYLKSRPQHGLAYFYWNSEDLSPLPGAALVASLLWQLAAQEKKVQDILPRVKLSDLRNPDKALECLKNALVHFKHTYVFVDATDFDDFSTDDFFRDGFLRDLDSRDAIYTAITNLQKMPCISLLVTSRERVNAYKYLPSLLARCRVVGLDASNEAHIMELYAVIKLGWYQGNQRTMVAAMIEEVQPCFCGRHGTKFRTRQELVSHICTEHLPAKRPYVLPVPEN